MDYESHSKFINRMIKTISLFSRSFPLCLLWHTAVMEHSPKSEKQELMLTIKLLNHNNYEEKQRF